LLRCSIFCPGTTHWAAGTDYLLFGARVHDMIGPARASIWEDPECQSHTKAKVPGFLGACQATSADAKIYFVTQPMFCSVTIAWTAAHQRMAANLFYSPQLAPKM
jgi:hypothetical protein